MKIELVRADIKYKPVLANLLELYIYDFSQLQGRNVKEDGRYGYKYLDLYWQEPNKHPFLIKINDKLAGFVFVDENDSDAYSEYPLGITEFFVMRKYRHKGIGEKVALRIFNMFPGKWTIREEEKNKSAQEFWRKIIYRYTNGNFKEINLSNKKWKGPIQLFDNSKNNLTK